MNKHTGIVIVASIIIVAPFAFTLWNAYAVENMQLRGIEPEEFSYYSMIADGEITICNPMPLPVSFEYLKIIPVHKGESKGVFLVEEQNIDSNSMTNVGISFSSDTYSESQYLFLHMDSQFDGAVPVRIDPRTFFVITEIQTSLFGIIPFTVSNEISGFDFNEIMSGKANAFSC